MIEVLSTIRSVAAILLVGNLLIICHEVGHYLVARSFGVQARRFTIGVGPKLARHVDRRGTVWKLALVPLGGFVSFEGEKDTLRPSSYAAKPPLTRIAIIVAGPAANVLVAIAVFGIMLSTLGQPAFRPVADTIVAGSAAERAGLQVGDQVLTMNGKAMKTFEDMRPGLRDNPGRVVRLDISRHGKVIELFAGLDSTKEGGRTIGLLGIRSTTPFREALSAPQVILGALEKTWGAIADSVTGITKLVVKGQGTENIAGVVGIAQLTGQVAQQGIGPLLALVAILSANLALMNLLPIPILDGGALLFCAAEIVLRRPLSARVQDFGTRSGLAVLVSLFMLTTVHDLDQSGLFRWLSQL